MEGIKMNENKKKTKQNGKKKRTKNNNVDRERESIYIQTEQLTHTKPIWNRTREGATYMLEETERTKLKYIYGRREKEKKKKKLYI